MFIVVPRRIHVGGGKGNLVLTWLTPPVLPQKSRRPPQQNPRNQHYPHQWLQHQRKPCRSLLSAHRKVLRRSHHSYRVADWSSRPKVLPLPPRRALPCRHPMRGLLAGNARLILSCCLVRTRPLGAADFAQSVLRQPGWSRQICRRLECLRHCVPRCGPFGLLDSHSAASHMPFMPPHRSSMDAHVKPKCFLGSLGVLSQLPASRRHWVVRVLHSAGVFRTRR